MDQDSSSQKNNDLEIDVENNVKIDVENDPETYAENDLKVEIENIIVSRGVDCCTDWKVFFAVCSVKKPHERLVYIKLTDPYNILPKIDHVVESNDLVKKLISYFMKSNEELDLICGNTNPKDYRKNIATTLYNLCLGEKEEVKENRMKSLF